MKTIANRLIKAASLLVKQAHNERTIEKIKQLAAEAFGMHAYKEDYTVSVKKHLVPMHLFVYGAVFILINR